MHFWYKFFTYLFYPVAPIYLYIRKLRKKEHPNRYLEKLSKINIKRENGYLVWFHVASIGEAMSVLPIIEDCVKNSRIDKILITSITLSSGKVLEKKFDNNTKVCHQFLPLDINILTNKFLNHWKPNLCIFIDSEIWPNIILQISKRKIPLLLFNARITKKSFLRWKLAINFARKIFEKFDLCITSNKESEEFLKILGAKNIKNYGNLKFTKTKNEINKKLDPLLLEKIKKRKIWCAASTHSDEEIMCAKSHLNIKKVYSEVLTIIIPRHVNRVNEINKELSNLNLNVVLYSNFENVNSNTDILLIDTYGEAIKFYNISKYVFLGKSLVEELKNDSGQNPIEPSRFGCKVFHGPNISNFKEIYDYLNSLGITKKINNYEELSRALVEEFQENKAKNHEIALKLENYGQNIFNNVTNELQKYI
tara:strand:+ start:745 stop:2010 length:1266 start_codon:yes stop_codon:yes gene_type:complete